MKITYTQDNIGRSKLEAVVEAWGFVQNENTSQRKYVTESEWDQWARHDNKTSAELNTVIEAYNGRSLSADQDQILEKIISSVGGAKRMTEDELVEREFKRIAEAEAEADRKRNAEQKVKAEVEKKKELDSFKSKLKGLFKRN